MYFHSIVSVLLVKYALLIVLGLIICCICSILACQRRCEVSLIRELFVLYITPQTN